MSEKNSLGNGENCPGSGVRAPFAMVGFGTIGRAVLELLSEEELEYCVGVIVRSERTTDGYRHPQADRVVGADLEAILRQRPALVVECAGHGALASYGRKVLGAGCDLIAVSSGALADEQLEQDLRRASWDAKRRVIIPAGAIIGIDGIAAAEVGGLSEVVYRGCKPPAAWRGSHAESLIRLEQLDDRRIFFEGSARVAAQLYPKNANVAATVALAGLGFEKTLVQLIADPELKVNRHEVTARGAFGSLSLSIEANPAASNPRTSMQTAYSVVRCLRNELGCGICL